MDNNDKKILPRLELLDALRGIAVILMVQQHLMPWLWNEPWDSFQRLYAIHPVMMSINMLGYLAAPIFVTLAGTGTVFLVERNPRPDRALIVRGIAVMAFGYLLNIATPSWFSPWSWYVLHVIGFAFILSPALLRLNTALLIAGGILSLAAAVLIQTHLGTPLLLMDAYMNNASKPGGILRIALAEGHFPVFPWLMLFMFGIAAGRWMRNGKTRNIVALAGLSLMTGIVLTLIYFRGYPFATYGTFYRAFVFLPYFYPALPPAMLILTGTVLLFMAAVSACGPDRNIRATAPLAWIGRLSLTFFMTHVVFFREGCELFECYKGFSTGATANIVGTTLVLIVAIAAFWKRKNFIFSAEWLMRRITG